MALTLVLYRQKQHQTVRVTALKKIIYTSTTINSGAEQTTQQRLRITLVIVHKYWRFCGDSGRILFTLFSAPRNRSTAKSCWPSCLGLVRKRKITAGLPKGGQHWWRKLAELQIFQAWSSLERVPAGFANCPAAEGKPVLEYRSFHTSQFTVV